MEGFEIYKLLHNRQVAEEMSRILERAGIKCEITQSRQYFDPSFAFNKVDPDVNLKIKPEDFKQANQILKEYYEQQLEMVDKEYYLFTFSDAELIELVRKQDEWGSFDVELAKRILHDRGIEITDEIETEVEKQRLQELGKPEKASRFMIIGGYITALLGGFFGMLFGWLLCTTKTLPDGQRVPMYTLEDRRHGQRMILIGFIVFAFLMGRALIQSFLSQGPLQ
jgi:hypothetical protein